MKNLTDNNEGQIVIPSDGFLMPLNLPPTNTVRWVARRKAEVVAAVLAGALTMMDACRRYHLCAEEFREWERHYKAGDLGTPAVRPRLPSRALH